MGLAKTAIVYDRYSKYSQPVMYGFSEMTAGSVSGGIISTSWGLTEFCSVIHLIYLWFKTHLWEMFIHRLQMVASSSSQLVVLLSLSPLVECKMAVKETSCLYWPWDKGQVWWTAQRRACRFTTSLDNPVSIKTFLHTGVKDYTGGPGE